MSLGEILSALLLQASDWDGRNWLLQASVWQIQVCDDEIEISFVDGNTPDIIIDKNGKFIRYA